MSTPAKADVFHLTDGRTLHYASAGNSSASSVILFFSGLLSTGTATEASIPPCFDRATVHYIAPTIPGNGASSSTPRGTPYHENLITTITALLDHLHPANGPTTIRTLYLAGGSYGTVMAQMLYGAPVSAFPFGAHIRGLLLLAPFSPFAQHADYARDMTWTNWLSVGPPSRWLPFHRLLVTRLLSVILSQQCRDRAGARKILDAALFGGMSAAEQEELAAYACRKRNLTAEEFKNEMADATLACVMGNLEGFVETADVLHSNWGFRIAGLAAAGDGDRRPPVLVVRSAADPLGEGMASWLVEHYGPNARLRVVEGGHLAALYHMDEIWAEMVQMGENPTQEAVHNL